MASKRSFPLSSPFWGHAPEPCGSLLATPNALHMLATNQMRLPDQRNASLLSSCVSSPEAASENTHARCCPDVDSRNQDGCDTRACFQIYHWEGWSSQLLPRSTLQRSSTLLTSDLSSS